MSTHTDPVSAPADLVLLGGRVHTQASPARAQAVAVTGRRIVYVGDDNGAAAWIGPDTRVVPLDGRLVVPAFVDAHMHPSHGAYRYAFCLPVFGINDKDLKTAYVAAVERFAKEHPDASWIQGAGFRRAAFDDIGPRKEWLDAVESRRPVTILSKDGHSLWANSRALEAAGITADTPNPLNGVIQRDPETGQPTGLLQEAAMGLVTAHIPPATKDQVRAALLWLQRWLNKEGITTAMDAILELDAPEVYEAFEELAAEGLLTMRYRGAWRLDPDRDVAADIDRALNISRRFTTPYFQTPVFKFFADEVIEEETAYLMAPYAHRNDGWRGLKDWDNDALLDAFVRVREAGGQVHIHTIGDGAVNYVLDVLAAMPQGADPATWRPALAHVQLVAEADFRRMAELGVTAVTAPYWSIIDDYFWELYVDYLGRQRAFFEQYPQKSFFNAGVNVAFHSDFSVVEPDALWALYSARTRRLPRRIYDETFGEKPGYSYVTETRTDYEPRQIGALPPESEALSMEEAVRAFTMGGAYSLFLENDLGAVTPGRLADLVVLDHDLFAIDPEALPETRVAMTLFEGRIVYEDDGSIPTGTHPPLPR